MNLIVNVDKNWAIGRDGDQLFYISEDLKYFKEKTYNKTVVMGRKTLLALPGASPLKNRTNIVLSRSVKHISDALCFQNYDDLKRHLSLLNPDDIFIIGGGQVYKDLLPYCKKAYITKIFAAADADRFFPNLDNMDNWALKTSSEVKNHDGLEFQYCVYVNSNPKGLV